MDHPALLWCKRFASAQGGDALASRRDSLRWGAFALLSLVIGVAALDAAPLGPFARHMAQHILTMSVVAPLAALALLAAAHQGTRLFASGQPAALALATTSQLVLLWGWHAPGAIETALHATGMHLLMQLSLSAAARWFWLEVLSDRGVFRWHALLALLVTGKLFCLLGVLLVFAPRVIYAARTSTHGHDAAFAVDALADQHLAGLLMVIACPLTYVLAGVIIAAHALRSFSDDAARPVAASPSKS